MKGKFWVLAVIISAVVAGSAGYFACLYLGQRVTLGDDTYKAVEIGRNYLENGFSREDPSPWVGDLLQVKLEMRDPNYYWYGYPWEEEVDRPEGESTLCWIIRFEQAKCPGHWFEVWVDADSGVPRYHNNQHGKFNYCAKLWGTFLFTLHPTDYIVVGNLPTT